MYSKKVKMLCSEKFKSNFKRYQKKGQRRRSCAQCMDGGIEVLILVHAVLNTGADELKDPEM